MMLKEPGETIELKLLKRLLERGLVISKDEAVEYWECFRPLLTKGVIVEYKNCFKILPECCLLLLQKLVGSGFHLETLFKSVNWRGFERIIAEIFRLHDFKVQEHFRFRIGKVLREIDLLVEAPSLFLSIDCKQWVRRNYSLKTACRLQFERSKLLLKYLIEKNILKEVYSLVLTFLDSEVIFMNNCIVIPVWKIRDLVEAPEILEEIGKPVSLL
ncbi:MAG: hypothetical protein QXR97_03760 [Thermoproteota archaeon]